MQLHQIDNTNCDGEHHYDDYVMARRTATAMKMSTAMAMAPALAIHATNKTCLARIGLDGLGFRV